MLVPARLLAALLPLSLGLGLSGAAGGASGPGGSKPELMFVLNARSGSLRSVAAGRYVLTLEGVAPETVAFADRPKRLTDNLKTSAFFARFWGRGSSFVKDPPNAALDLVTGENDGDAIVFELRRPRLHGSTLTFAARRVAASAGLSHYGNRVDSSPPASFADASLFIDSIAP
jgi:hypothetical protein